MAGGPSSMLLQNLNFYVNTIQHPFIPLAYGGTEIYQFELPLQAPQVPQDFVRV
jgi:hypothetical protein